LARPRRARSRSITRRCRTSPQGVPALIDELSRLDSRWLYIFWLLLSPHSFVAGGGAKTVTASRCEWVAEGKSENPKHEIRKQIPKPNQADDHNRRPRGFGLLVFALFELVSDFECGF